MTVLQDHADELVISKTRRKIPTSDFRFDHMKIQLRCLVVELELWMTIPLLFLLLLKSSAFR